MAQRCWPLHHPLRGRSPSPSLRDREDITAATGRLLSSHPDRRLATQMGWKAEVKPIRRRCPVRVEKIWAIRAPQMRIRT